MELRSNENQNACPILIENKISTRRGSGIDLMPASSASSRAPGLFYPGSSIYIIT